MKLTIYHGAARPFVAIGKNQCNVLDFAFKYQGWHSYSKDKPTMQALNALIKRGCLIVNQYEQFKINLGA